MPTAPQTRAPRGMEGGTILNTAERTRVCVQAATGSHSAKQHPHPMGRLARGGACKRTRKLQSSLGLIPMLRTSTAIGSLKQKAP